MTTVLLTIHIIVALLLIVVVLMQRGTGADMGSSFGGGSSQTLFGSGGSASFLSKTTGVLAGIFMMTSLSLAFFSQQDAGSVLNKGLQPSAEQQLPGAGDTGRATPAAFDVEKLMDDAPQDALPTAE
ncbi:MAG: preprotein translocase subunit SecG [Mariprofundaceae bacterium]|nr:preprotein translocase subunit SecG [Mariprofundaceae bacterium]